jgi:hypothetical protein
MSYIHDTIPRYQSQGRNVHWNDEQISLPPPPPPPRRSSSQHTFQHETQPGYYSSDSNIIKKNGQCISLNASLPNNSKLNIRIHADRTSCDDINDNNNNNNLKKVQATATIEPLDSSQYEQEHVDTLRRNYLEHYSTGLPNENLITMTRTDSPIQQQQYQRESRRDKLPRHRQVSLPISLPIDQRLYLYIHNGEVLARC